MQVSAVALAVQTVANAVSGLPVKLYVRNGKGKEAAPFDPSLKWSYLYVKPRTTLVFVVRRIGGSGPSLTGTAPWP